MGFQTWDISICLYLNLKYADLNHKATMDSLIHEFIPIAFISCLAVAIFLFQELLALNASVPKPHQLCSISTFNDTMIKASMLNFIQFTSKPLSLSLSPPYLYSCKVARHPLCFITRMSVQSFNWRCKD